MPSKITYWKHGLMLTAVYILGSTLLTFPSGNHAYGGIYGLAFALIPALAFFPLYVKIKKGNPQELLSAKGGSITVILLLLLCGGGIALTAGEYSRFIDTMRLPNTSIYVIIGIFIALSIMLGTAKEKVIYLFSLIGAIFIAVFTVIMFLFSLPFFKMEYLKLITTATVIGAFKQGMGLFIQSFGFCVVLVFFGNSTKKPLKQQYLGLLLGAAVMSISFLNVLAVLGGVTENLSYPYVTVTETVSVGRIYTRLEGFSYAVYFICALIKTSVLVSVALTAARALNKKIKSWLWLPLSAVAVIGAVWGELIFGSRAVNFTLLGIEILLPLILFIGVKLKS